MSVRDREQPTKRHVRDGFFNLPGEPVNDAPEQVVQAAMKAARSLAASAEGAAILEASSIAVTFLSKLERVQVGDLDNDRYGILVQSRERPFVVGGALPGMPGIASTWAQFEHARTRNAKLFPFEPFDLYRYDVSKQVEPDRAWPEGGVARRAAPAWTRDPERVGRVAEYARRVVVALRDRTAEPSEHLPETLLGDSNVESIFVTIYSEGRMTGCMGVPVTTLDESVRAAARLAWSDGRFDPHERDDPAISLAVAVTLLYDARELPALSPEAASDEVEVGRHALMVHQGERVGLLLPFLGVTDNLDPQAFVLEVVDKAGITRPPYHWTRFEAVAWLADGSVSCGIDGAFPRRPPNTHTRLAAMIELLTGYLATHQRDNGALLLGYRPFQNEAFEGDDPLRLVYGAITLLRAGEALSRTDLRERGVRAFTAARRIYGWAECCTGEQVAKAPTNVAAFALLYRCESERDGRSDREGALLAASLWSRIDRHGCIPTPDADAARVEALQDFEPGQALLALASACATSRSEIDEARLARAFRYYRHRHRHRHGWAHLNWQLQAGAAWWALRREPAFAEYVFEIADGMLPYQHPASGGFYDGEPYPWPGVPSVVYLEGLASALAVARAVGDSARVEAYGAAAERTLRLLDRLIIQHDDARVLPNPRWALGGVRMSTSSSDVRTDFVQHALAAVVALLPLEL